LQLSSCSGQVNIVFEMYWLISIFRSDYLQDSSQFDRATRNEQLGYELWIGFRDLLGCILVLLSWLG
jgi:hypothetical protein